MPAPRWPEVPARPDLPALEREVLAAWRRDDVFARSVAARSDGPVWTFYEGPPTANGRPGVHHVESRVFKDVFPRYRTMKGASVRRKGGWDCHGLPVELEVERELGLDSKAEIEAYGIERFNARCRESVQRYVGAFEELTERIGFWIDTEDAYWTMAPEYVDSLWWALGELWDRDLLFEDFRVAPYCGRCGTALSDAEVALGYDEVTDPSVYVRLPLTATGGAPDALAGAALVAWTTTPWTLPSNVACAVGTELTYAVAEREGPEGTERLVVAADLVTEVLGDGARIVATLPGADLVGRTYVAPFDVLPAEGAHRVVAAEFVTTTDGTGIVHLAPAFGADDLAVGRREGLPVLNPVGPDGRFTTGPWSGRFVKDADPDIEADLRARGLLVASRPYRHTYPFCWRCKQPLIYWAKPSWYVRTTARREDLLANNAGIGWQPPHIRDGRFGNWLENNVDWALSRDRYWGTPLPFWRCGAGHVTVVRSRAHLSELAGADHHDLDPHRPFVDEVTLPCPDCGDEARRVPDVADAWFDSGAMPFAQWGYPWRGRAEFERHYPADYICEAIDQTRGWFYTLLAESTLLFGDSSFRNVVCLGHIVDEDGRKMSKSAGNVLDPATVIERHGADALRWLMFADGSPWVSRRVGDQQLEDVVRRFLLTVWNTHVFFTTYARIDGFDPAGDAPAVASRPVLDRWVLAELAETVTAVDTGLAAYDVTIATRRLERFVDDLSNWYVRRARRRFWRGPDADPSDKAAAFHTLHTCLTVLARLLAPFTPFLAERLWQDLAVGVDPTAPTSVHLTDFPTADPTWIDTEVLAAMATARRLVELGRQARTDAGVRVRQPLARAVVTVAPDERATLARTLGEVAEELNIHRVELAGADAADVVERSLRPAFRALGPVFGEDAPRVAAALRDLSPEAVDALVAEVAAAGSGSLAVDGAPRAIEAAMFEVVETPRTGWAVVGDGTRSLALDTTITPELRLEGAARELVRAVNDRRRAGGLDLTDRIVLGLSVSPPELDAALGTSGLYDLVARETLAVRIDRATAGAEAARGEDALDLGDLGSIAIDITRAT